MLAEGVENALCFADVGCNIFDAFASGTVAGGHCNCEIICTAVKFPLRHHDDTAFKACAVVELFAAIKNGCFACFRKDFIHFYRYSGG